MLYFCFICMGILSVCLYVYYICAWCLWKSEESKGFPEIGVKDGCKPPHWDLELNLVLSTRAVNAPNQ